MEHAQPKLEQPLLHPVWEFGLKDTLETLGKDIELLRQRQKTHEVW